jgi:hypothetical protein
VVSCHVIEWEVSAWTVSTMRRMLFFEGRMPRRAWPVLAVIHTRSRKVEMPSGLNLPLAFGINTRLIGSGWSSRPRHGVSRVACASLVYMLSPLPRRSDWVPHLLASPVVSAFPDMAVRSARTSSFSRLVRCSLALRPAHSRCHRMSWHA